MDAIEFIKAMKQMLSAGANCSTVQKCISAYKKNDYEGIVEAAEQWAAEHPRKTRQSVFLEQYPEADLDDCGVLKACPIPISASHRNIYGRCACTGVKCSDCRREFWMQEVE